MDLQESGNKVQGQRGLWQRPAGLVWMLRSLNRLNAALFATFGQQTSLGWMLRYGFAVAAVFAALVFRLWCEAWVGPGLPTYITFYPVVMVAALFGGLGSGFVATVVTGLVTVFFIITPGDHFSLGLPVDRLGLAIFTGLGLFMSLVAHSYRRNMEKAAAYDREREFLAINREKSFLANLLENADQPFAVSYPDGRLGLVNRAFELLTGYTAAELRNVDWSVTLTPPEWRELEREKLVELQSSGEPVRYEKEYLRKDGSRVPVEKQVNIMRDAAGRPEYYYSFLTDISERKWAEKELRRKEADLNEAQHLAHIGSWYWDAQTDVTTGSDELLRIYGFDPATQAMPNFADQKGLCYPAEDWQLVNAAVQRAVQTGSGYELDVRALRDHKQIWITTRCEVVRNAAGGITGLRGTVQDITPRKQVEEALRESERRERQRADELAALLEAVPIPVFIVHDPESTHMTGNRAADELLLLPRGAEVSLSAPQETRPRHFTAIKDGCKLQVDELPAQRAARGEQVRDFEFSLVFDDGATRHLLGYGTPLLDEQGRPRGAVHVLVDITERKRAEEALKQSQEDFVRAQQVGQIGSWRLDVRRNELIWSDENHRIFGIPPGTPLTYETFLAAVHPDDRGYVDTRWQAGLRGEPYDIEHRLLVGGQVTWVREKAYLEFEADGSLIGGFGITQDISKRRQAEAEIRLLNEQLLGKLAELEAANQELEGFTYSVSHDLRAPVRHIEGFAKLLEMKTGPELNAEGRKFIGIIVDAADKLGVLMDELLDFSRMRCAAIGISEVDLGPLCSEVVEDFRIRSGPRQIEWRLGKLPVVHGDATMLRFVVENLIDNAVKFTSTRELARIEIGQAEDEDNFIVFVKDNGVGFDMVYYDKLFGVFQRLHSKEAFDGTGIGLANVRRIIHRHGGKVWAEGKINEGAVFSFSLPKEQQG